MSTPLITLHPHFDINARFSSAIKYPPCQTPSFITKVFSLLGLDVAQNAEEFWRDFPKQISLILQSLPAINALSSVIDRQYLVQKIINIVNSLLLHHKELKESNKEIDLPEAQGLYKIAKQVKSIETIWKGLPKAHQDFFHSLLPWSTEFITWHELCQRGIKPIHGEDGQSFLVDSHGQVDNDNYVLINFSDFFLTYILEREPLLVLSQLQFVNGKFKFDYKNLGRIGEIFSIKTLKLKLENAQRRKEERLSTIIKNRFLEVLKCYKSGLYSTMNLPVYLPEAICQEGSWSIWPLEKPKALSAELFSAEVVADIHRHFHLEKLWKINLLHGMLSYPIKFQVKGGRAFLTGLQPLPTMLKEEHRHQLYKLKLNLPSEYEMKWEELEKISAVELEKQESHLVQLKKFHGNGLFTLEEIVKMSSKVVLLMRYITQTKENDISKVTLPDLIALAGDLNSYLVVKPEKQGTNEELEIEACPSEPTETVTVEMISAGKLFEEMITELERKKEKLLERMVDFVLQRLEKRAILDKHQIMEEAQSLSEIMCLNILQDFPQGSKEYFRGMFCGEFLEKIDEVFSVKDTFTDLHHRLTLLRFASEQGFDKAKLDVVLQSVLHDSLVETSQHKFLAAFREHLQAFQGMR